MRYTALTIKNQNIELGQPYSVKINKSKDAPADDIIVVFPIDKVIDELKSISVYSGENLFFYGVIDEQNVKYTSSGVFLTIIARSMAAFLLDNEALPQTYYLPSLKTIFEKHIKMYGFKGYIGESKSFSSEFVVSKGMSEWDVLENFCFNYLKVSPRITNDGYIDATGKNVGKEINFSNVGQGIKYSSISENKKRYKRLSQVFVRATKNGSYSINVSDYEAINNGIKRKRYLNYSNNKTTPIESGEIMLAQAKKDSYEFILEVPGNININIIDTIKINDYTLSKLENLKVYEIKYTLDSTSEITQIKAIF